MIKSKRYTSYRFDENERAIYVECGFKGDDSKDVFKIDKNGLKAYFADDEGRLTYKCDLENLFEIFIDFVVENEDA